MEYKKHLKRNKRKEECRYLIRNVSGRLIVIIGCGVDVYD